MTVHVVDHVTGRDQDTAHGAGRVPRSVEQEVDPDIDHVHVHASLDVSVAVDRGQDTDLAPPDVDTLLEAGKILEVAKEAAAQVAAALVTEIGVGMTANTNAVIDQEADLKGDPIHLTNPLPDLMLLTL